MGVGIVDDFSWRLTRRQNGAATFPPDSSTLNETSVLLLYSGDLNTNNLNSGNIWIPKFLKFGFQMVQYSNGQSIGYALCLRPTIQIPDQYIRKQDGIHLSSIQIVGLSGIQMAFKNQTIWHLTSFQPFEYRTSLQFRSPQYSLTKYKLAIVRHVKPVFTCYFIPTI